MIPSSTLQEAFKVTLICRCSVQRAFITTLIIRCTLQQGFKVIPQLWSLIYAKFKEFHLSASFSV